MSNYLVTGGLGVIGSQFALEMLQKGHDVTILDSRKQLRNEWTQKQIQRAYPKTIIVIDAIESIDVLTLAGIIKGYDFILHAAAHTGIPHSAEDPGDDWRSNVDATRRLLEALRQNRKKIPTVALSSVKPYKVQSMDTFRRCFDEGKRELLLAEKLWPGLSETTELEPDEPYAASKMAQSALCMAYGRTYDLPITTLRCSNLYGPAPCHGPRHGWLTWFCIQAVLGLEINIQGTGYQTRDMLFSTDVNQAVLTAFSHMPDLQGKVFNIGGGVRNTISCLDAVKKLMTLNFDKPIKVKYTEGRKFEDMLVYANYDRFWKATGWNPSITVDDGMLTILAWADANKDDLREIYASTA